MTYKKKEQVKKTVRKTEPPPEPEPEPEPEATPPEPASPGSPGTRSQVRVDQPDFRFAYYLEIVRERVSAAWSPPPAAGGSGGVMATVYFRISRDGRITDFSIEQTSGRDLFDRSALRAVEMASPLPPLPAGFKGRWLGVHFEFQQTSI
jgi:TonB family protein